MTKALCPAFSQKNLPLGQAEVPGSSEPSWSMERLDESRKVWRNCEIDERCFIWPRNHSSHRWLGWMERCCSRQNIGNQSPDCTLKQPGRKLVDDIHQIWAVIYRNLISSAYWAGQKSPQPWFPLVLTLVSSWPRRPGLSRGSWSAARLVIRTGHHIET